MSTDRSRLRPNAPRPGDRVRWSQSGTEWFVLSADEERETAVICERLLGTTQEFETPFVELEIVERCLTTGGPRALGPDYPRPILRVVGDDHEPEEESADIADHEDVQADERGFRARTVDSLLFSHTCLRQYQRQFAPKIPLGRCEKHLQWLLRKHGAVIRRAPGEYVRIRIRGRFDVVVPRRPRHGEFITIEELQPLKRPRRRAA